MIFDYLESTKFCYYLESFWSFRSRKEISGLIYAGRKYIEGFISYTSLCEKNNKRKLSNFLPLNRNIENNSIKVSKSHFNMFRTLILWPIKILDSI